MFVTGWKWKTRKIMIPFPLPSVLSYDSLVSVKENTDKESKKEERMKEKKYGLKAKQNKLSAPHVMHNVKILSQ